MTERGAKTQTEEREGSPRGHKQCFRSKARPRLPFSGLWP